MQFLPVPLTLQLKMNRIIIFFSEMGRHSVYLGHLIAYVLFKISRKISPETESLHLTHGFVFNKLGSRWRHGGLIHIMPIYILLKHLVVKGKIRLELMVPLRSQTCFVLISAQIDKNYTNFGDVFCLHYQCNQTQSLSSN